MAILNSSKGVLLPDLILEGLGQTAGLIFNPVINDIQEKTNVIIQ